MYFIFINYSIPQKINYSLPITHNLSSEVFFVFLQNNLKPFRKMRRTFNHFFF